MFYHLIKKNLLSLISILTIGISGYFWYLSFAKFFTPYDEIATVVGISIACALIACFVLSPVRTWWGRRKLEFLFFCFSISFSSFATHDSIKRNKEVLQIKKATQEITRLTNGSDKLSCQPSITEYSYEEFGFFSKLLPLIKDSLEFSQKAVEETNDAVADLENILSLENLCEYKKIIKSKAKIANYLKKIIFLEQGYTKELSFVREKVKETFAEDPILQKHILIGFEKQKKITDKLMYEYFNVEKEAAQKLEAIFNFFLSKLGTFSISDDLIIFETDEDVDMYDQLFLSFMEQEDKENAIKEKFEIEREIFLHTIKEFDMAL